MGTNRGKVVVAMSGGVDSSVAAAMLLREGYEVMGAFLRLGTPRGVEAHDACDPAPGKQGCCSVLDAGDARRVAGLLGIPFYVLNFQDDFGRIVDYFVGEYNRGRTPNPCVRCNDWLKFGKLAAYAQAVGAEYIATGHYARVETDARTGQKVLMRGLDGRKDQSYVLFGLSRAVLERTLLPIGRMEKPRVRAMAAELGLPVCDKPDSQEICFVPDQDYAALVQRRTPEAFKQGDFIDASGNVVGQHEGHQHFTIGQRKGLRLAMGRPVYVTDIDAASNRITIGDRPSLLRNSLVAKEINWLGPRAIGEMRDLSCMAKIRYNHLPQPARATVLGDELRVTFVEPQSAITPGQAVVIYENEVVLGGGWIDRAE